MTPRNSRGVFLFPGEPMGVAKALKARLRKDRPVPALEGLARDIAIARQVIEPGPARPEFQQPCGIARADTRDVTGHVAQGPKNMNPTRRRLARGGVVDQDRDTAGTDQAMEVQQG